MFINKPIWAADIVLYIISNIDGVVPVVSILFRNMQRFLETTDRNDTYAHTA